MIDPIKLSWHLAHWAARRWPTVGSTAEEWLGEAWLIVNTYARRWREDGGLTQISYILRYARRKLADEMHRRYGRQFTKENGNHRWHRPDMTDLTPDVQVVRDTSSFPRQPIDEAVHFLFEHLSEKGPILFPLIRHEARTRGISRTTLLHARRQLGVTSRFTTGGQGLRVWELKGGLCPRNS